jgi:hypothetical protein
MSPVNSKAVEVCGNCGAPLDLGADGECRWCRAKVRTGQPWPWRPGGSRPGVSWRRYRRAGAIAAVAVAAAAGLGVAISGYVGSHQSGPPSAAHSGLPSAAGQGVAPGSTDLQALRQDFGPWRQLSGPSADGTALLLLQGGAAWSSARWAVPSGARWWTQDLGGNVTAVTVSGGHASIADADGVGYTVGVNQAFIVASNPGTVLLIRPDGTVMSMSLAQATAVRQHLRR